MAEGKRISRRTRKILEELAERIIPSGGVEYPGAKELAVVDRLIERASRIPGMFLALKIFAWSWELAPVWFFRFSLFTWMSPERQNRFLESFEKSRFLVKRWAIMGCKAVFMAVFYNQPLVWEKIGYKAGKCFAGSASQEGK